MNELMNFLVWTFAMFLSAAILKLIDMMVLNDTISNTITMFYNFVKKILRNDRR